MKYTWVTLLWVLPRAHSTFSFTISTRKQEVHKYGQHR